MSGSRSPAQAQTVRSLRSTEMPGRGSSAVRDPVPARVATPHRVALLIEPRFPGGTSAAVAAEIGALASRVELEVVDLSTAMFAGREVNPRLAQALEDAGLFLCRHRSVVRADTVVLHNPACLKFDRSLALRVSCRTLLVVAHENFLRPDGGEGFDVEHCLEMIDSAICNRRLVVPISAPNRRGVEEWLGRRSLDWQVAPFDWPSICDMPQVPPEAQPRDRRGRHSRPGLEKFPGRDRLLVQFPSHAERCLILGGDILLEDPQGLPQHWDVRRFGEMSVAHFLEQIDFFVYFTNPNWQESFGRAVAEAIAAGKVVITDPATAEPFGGAVVPAHDEDIDRIIAEFRAAPELYRSFVAAAQAWLGAQGPERFHRVVLPELQMFGRGDHAVL